MRSIMKNVYLFLTLLLLSSCFLGGCSKDETPQGTIISGTLESAIPATSYTDPASPAAKYEHESLEHPRS